MAAKTIEGSTADRRAASRGSVLGKGLSALIRGAEIPIARAEGREVCEIPIDDLVHDPRQPRKVFHQDKLDELAASIKDVGVLQPILVREIRPDERLATGRGLSAPAAAEDRAEDRGKDQGDDQSEDQGGRARPVASPLAHHVATGKKRRQANDNKEIKAYIVVAGERRARAARLAGLTSVPALICSFEETEALRVALMENIQRENLGPIEEALAYRELLEAYGATQDELATLLGKNRSTVTNTLRLLTLEEELQELVEDGTLTRGHAKALLGLPPGQGRLRLARLCRSRGLSVREVERRAQGTLAARQRTRRKRSTGAQAGKPGETPEIRALQARAEEYFGSPVAIECPQHKPGRFIVTFYGDADLERLLAMMGLRTDLG